MILAIYKEKDDVFIQNVSMSNNLLSVHFLKFLNTLFFVINTERMSPNSENIASVTVCAFPCCCFVLKYCVCEHTLSYFVGFIECV